MPLWFMITIIVLLVFILFALYSISEKIWKLTGQLEEVDKSLSLKPVIDDKLEALKEIDKSVYLGLNNVQDAISGTDEKLFEIKETLDAIEDSINKKAGGNNEND
jgi:hypothetical protein